MLGRKKLETRHGKVGDKTSTWWERHTFPNKFKSCHILSAITSLLLIYVGSQYLNMPTSITNFVFHKINNNSAKEDFLTNCRRLMKARTDWKRLLSPCAKNMEFASYIPGWEQQSRTSAHKSYISSMDVRKAGEFSTIWFRSRTKDNKEKNIGGDFWRVIFTGAASVAATVFDHENGSYEAIALLMEPGEYNVQVMLEYTLCEGMWNPPGHWFRAGNAQGRLQPKGTINNKYDNVYYFDPLEGKSKITIHVLPNNNTNVTDFVEESCEKACVTIGNGYGRWVENNWKPYHTPETFRKRVTTPVNEKNRNASGKLLMFGDSLAKAFANAIGQHPLCRHVFSSCGFVRNWIYPVPAVRNISWDDFDFRPDIVLQSIRDALRQPGMLSKESLLVINLGLHYPIRLNFTTYQQLIYDVVNVLKTRKERLGSAAGVLWKTTTYFHKENHVKRLEMRFYTPQRVQLFETFTMSVMCEAGIDVLDVYPITASHPGKPGDGVHWRHSVFRNADIEIEQYAMPKFGRNRRKVCIG